MTNSTKRFEDWQEVDCNECSHYWDNSCDGSCKGDRKVCNSFLATRSVVIPAQLDKLRDDVKALAWASIIEFIMIIILALWK